MQRIWILWTVTSAIHLFTFEAQAAESPSTNSHFKQGTILCGQIVRSASAALKLDATYPRLIQAISANVPGVRGVNRDYLRFLDTRDPNKNVFEEGLKFWDVKLSYNLDGFEIVPQDKPIVLMANHPFGFRDGLALGALGYRLRRDRHRMVATDSAKGLSAFQNDFIYVDNSETSGSADRNSVPMRQMLRLLQGNGALSIFPTGEVATKIDDQGNTVEGPWAFEVLAKLVERTGATVIPVFIDGTNSPEFYEWAEISPFLKRARLPWEFELQKGENIDLQIGRPIQFVELQDWPKDERMLYLQRRLDLLRDLRRETRPNATSGVTIEGLIDPIPRIFIDRELGLLPESSKIMEIKEGDTHIEIFVAAASEIPLTIREIARLRELTFRDVGEGTGKRIDLDEYDLRYGKHLFIRNSKTGEIIGGYRMAAGAHYTRDYYKIPDGELSPSDTLELSRAWVRPEYQGHVLQLLWSGIGRYLALNPRYKKFVGMVTLSNEIDPMSQQLMVEFVLQTFPKVPFADRVVAKSPPEYRAITRDEAKAIVAQLRNFDDLNKKIQELRPGAPKPPMLFPGYAMFGAQVLGINQDISFGNATDVALVVDVTQIRPRLRQRFMGEQGAETYRQYHGLER